MRSRLGAHFFCPSSSIIFLFLQKSWKFPRRGVEFGIMFEGIYLYKYFLTLKNESGYTKYATDGH